MYAIVDIETTGTYAAANGITEISIQVFDGEKVVEKFETLINPLQNIPRYIQSFTGITNQMVEDAPTFSQVAEKIYQVLHDKIFVAHNVNFDYSFIKNNLAIAGFELNVKKLCTVRMSRKIFPGFASYSLGNLCYSLGIPIHERHRAGGDARATVQVLNLLLQHDREQFIAKSLQRTSKEQVLPPNVSKQDFEKLPSRPGVYYFHNQKGKIVYVGKAINIKKRVNSHFSNNSDSRQKQNFLKHTYSISFQTCATELMACLLESSEIKRLWPAFNYSQKRWEDVYGIFSYEDQNGYLRLAIEKNKKNLQPVYTFHYLADGRSMLQGLVNKFLLCNKFCCLQSSTISCTGIEENICKGACEKKEPAAIYNERVLAAIASLQSQPSFVIMDEGLHQEESSCVMVWEGRLYGMGYVPKNLALTETDNLKTFIQPFKENSFTRKLVYSYATKHPAKVVSLMM